MSEPQEHTVASLARQCRGRVADASRADTAIRRVAFIDEATPDAVTWITEGKFAKALAATKAGAVIGTQAVLGDDPRGIIVADPEAAIAQILELFDVPQERPAPGVHPTAVVHPEASLAKDVAVGALAVIHKGVSLGEGAIIHEGVSIGRDVKIGRQSIIYDRCVIYDRCEIGNNVIIHAGAVIGADGFGYIFRDGRHRKVPQIGTVVIEDDVEIGANTCIDRAKLGATRIGRGSKIDNLVMIAHNVRLGPLCLLAGQVGLSGSVRLGTGVAMGGQAGVTDGVHVGDAARIGAKSAAIGDIGGGEIVWGIPARDHKTVLRDQARVRKLHELFEHVARLEQRVAELEAAADHRETG
jgi:UDP-3-O-[3-hydroxymyristoyl] glucosamine N-acyltransferase